MVEKIQGNLFAHNLTSGEDNIEEFQLVKKPATHLFLQGGFRLHKWHSKVTSLNISPTLGESNDANISNAK